MEVANNITQHRPTLNQEIDEIENGCTQLQQSISEQNPENNSLIEQINEWEENSIEKIRQTAEQCRQKLIELINQSTEKIENKCVQIIRQLNKFRTENDLTEIDLNCLKDKFTQLTNEFDQPSNISVEENSSSKYINEISIISKGEIKWKQHLINVAGGNEQGEQLNQLYCPSGISIDDDKTIYIADFDNHRILQWKSGEDKGEVIAGGNGRGDRIDQLTFPTDVIVDKQNNSLIIADGGNRRVIQCSIQDPTNQEILISDIDCWGVAMDKDGSIYVSDCVKNEVRRWKRGEIQGTIVAGGHGKRNQLNRFNTLDELNQLDHPTFIFVDKDHSIYVSDKNNDRVMKWLKDAKEGIIVAGGNGEGGSLKQLSSPWGVIVDHLDRIYVTDHMNNRVMRWCEDREQGEIFVDGKESKQLNRPAGLSFDVGGNLYIVDWANHRILKLFEVDLI